MVIRNLSDLPRALENLDRCYLQQAVIFYLVFATTSAARNNTIVTFTT